MADQIWLQLLPKLLRARLAGRHLFQKTIGNTGWLFCDKILRMGVGVVVGAWIARYLGPHQYGAWNYAVAFSSFFGVLAALGLDGVVVREMVRHPDRRDLILGTAFALKLMSGFAALLLSVAAVSLLRPGEGATALMVGLCSAGFVVQATGVIDLDYQSRVLSKYTVLSANAAFVLATALRLVLLVRAAPLLAFAVAGLVEVCCSALFLVVSYYYNRMTLRFFRFRSEMAKKLLRDSFPLILSGLAVMMYMRLDQLMIGQMLGDREVGVFVAATRVSEVWYFFPVAVMSSVYPVIIQSRSADPDLYRRRLQSLFNAMVLMAGVVAALMTFGSYPLIRLLYGPQYLASAPVLALHCWTGIFVCLGVASGSWLMAEDLQRLSLYRTLAGAVVNLLLNFWLIPLHGVKGAALATLGAQFVAAYLFDFSNRSTWPIFRMKTKALLGNFLVRKNWNA